MIEKNRIIDGLVTLLMVALALLFITLMSCSPKYPNIHTPKKREIKRAMRYSTWH